MIPEKVLNFIGSDEYYKIIENISNLCQINWQDERISKIFNLVDDMLIYNQTFENSIKELIKKNLDFINEDDANNIFQFLINNLSPKIKELWQQEQKTSQEIKNEEETFEEKEKKYFELMKAIIENQEIPINQKIKNQEKIEEKKEYKTIDFQPQKKENKKKDKKEKEDIFSESLPEGTIIITKKGEGSSSVDKEDFLDLSKL